jgi:NlpC/P60 family putative phage cell wall peptidase
MREKIIDVAHSWVGTPYHHQARVKGVGVDCAQLMAGIAIEAGIIPADTELPHDYSPEWHLHNRDEVLIDHLRRFGCVEKEVAEPGDIIGFTIGRAVGHLGILVSADTFIHAQCMADPKMVTLNSLSPEWKKRHTVTFSFPNGA